MPAVFVKNLNKTFMLHNQGGTELSVLQDVSLKVEAGECVVLIGPSGTGKSTFLRSIYANYKIQSGEILVKHEGRQVDIASADSRTVLNVRQKTIGHVSQFLRVIPRVPTLEIVAEPLRALGASEAMAKSRAMSLLNRLHIPEPLWSLSPVTFSGGEQQRVNIARTFVVDYPVLLLDEPTASLDEVNRQVVLNLVEEARKEGAAIIGIFHSEKDREKVATRLVKLDSLQVAA